MKRSPHVLLVEDNKADEELIKEILLEQGFVGQLSVARDGEEVISFLEDKKKADPKTLPDLIILDLSLPKKNGHEVLLEIKSDPVLYQTPVIVLTSSAAPRDIRSCFQAGVNCYLTKVSGLNEFVQLLQITGQFWLSLGKLPIDGKGISHASKG